MAKIDGLLCRPEMGWMFNFKTNSELKEFLLSIDILTVVINFLKFPVEICENPGNEQWRIQDLPQGVPTPDAATFR